MSEDFGAGSLATLLMDIRLSGDRQPDPIEFMAIDYKEYLKTEHWKTIASEARTKALNRCQLCNSDGLLNVHHRTYERLGHELPEDLIVLCQPCHAKFHNKPETVHEYHY